jgi:hypothetical protein
VNGRYQWRGAEHEETAFARVVFFLIVMTATTLASSQTRSAEQRERDAGIRGRLVGAWRLAWLEEEGADGKIHRADRTGMLV